MNSETGFEMMVSCGVQLWFMFVFHPLDVLEGLAERNGNPETSQVAFFRFSFALTFN